MKYLVLGVALLIPHVAIAADSVKIHALHQESFACFEHWDGQFKSLGDALGSDCIIQEFIGESDRYFMRSYTSKGFENTDWFGYKKDVLAPCDCTIEKVHINPVTNKPGIMTPGRASSIVFKKPDNTRILLAHVVDVIVREGQKVKAGAKVAKVGNNGYSRSPHIHVAAWKDKIPLQIQFDQKTLSLKKRKSSSN
ncbi:MAG: M23 family metallopeptidase [Algicola sp.]|nr:M23 family metallopeptidase [Algicola sp.]